MKIYLLIIERNFDFYVEIMRERERGIVYKEIEEGVM